MKRLAVGGLVLGLLAVRGAGAQELSLTQRFGPDGIPFTFDDPLAVGGSASGVRFGAFGGDACSEEKSLGTGAAAHGHPDGHPASARVEPGLLVASTDASPGHTSRETPGEALKDMAPGKTLKVPFDLTVWVSGMNLADGQMSRHRVLPEDTRWTSDASEVNHPSRGWVDAWTPEEVDGQHDMNRVSRAGAKARNIHLAALGVTGRDVKPEDGFAFSIWWETIDRFTFPGKDKFKRLDIMAQQAYVEATIAEVFNLDNFENGISGNFVADVAGVRLNGLQDWVVDKGLLCKVTLQNFPSVFGGPASVKPEFQIPPHLSAVDYHLKFPIPYPDPVYYGRTLFDVMWDNVQLSGLCTLAPGIVKPIAQGEAKKKFEKIDQIASLVAADDYQNISRYSGLAGGPGGDAKNPYDRMALGLLEKGGHFKPTQWLKWRHLGDNPLAGSFTSAENEAAAKEALGPLETTTKIFKEGKQDGKIRYNSGSTFLAKSAMLFGNSAAKDPTENPFDLLANDGKRGWPEIVAQTLDPAEFRKQTPDLLESFAKRWLYVRMDMVDPHKLPEIEGAAEWRSLDALIVHSNDNPPVRVEWPPPNFNFGRGQVEVFTTGSGGEPVAGDGNKPGPGTQAPDVALSTALMWKGLTCVDPVSKTFSVSGVGLRSKRGQPPGTGDVVRIPEAGIPAGVHLGWTEPRPLAELPTWLENGSRRRWLQAAANHHVEADATMKWMWDFELDGAVDSEHAQHMSEVGDEPVGAVFGYQATGGGAARGRTGFRFVPMD